MNFHWCYDSIEYEPAAVLFIVIFVYSQMGSFLKIIFNPHLLLILERQEGKERNTDVKD